MISEKRGESLRERADEAEEAAKEEEDSAGGSFLLSALGCDGDATSDIASAASFGLRGMEERFAASASVVESHSSSTPAGASERLLRASCRPVESSIIA